MFFLELQLEICQHLLRPMIAAGLPLCIDMANTSILDVSSIVDEPIARPQIITRPRSCSFLEPVPEQTITLWEAICATKSEESSAHEYGQQSEFLAKTGCDKDQYNVRT
jgi:hypothetical protein